MNLLLSPGEQHFPKLTYLGSTSVPKLISSYSIDVLCFLTFLSLWNLLFKSNIPSNVLTPFGIKLLFLRFDWCSSSSTTTSVKVSSFFKNSRICWLASNTFILMTLSGTNDLEINSMEHLLFVGTNLAAEVANKSAAAFLV